MVRLSRRLRGRYWNIYNRRCYYTKKDTIIKKIGRRRTMKKALSIILIITLIISMCSGVLCADEVVFEGEEGFEGDVIEEETVFEEPANEGEIEDVTEDSAVFHEEYISEDYSFDDNAYEITMYEDGQNEEIISSEEAATTFEDENILSKGSDLSEDVIISEETITDDPSFANAVNSGTYGDNITWKLSGVEDNLILTLTGSGPMKNYAKNSSIPWNKRRDEIVRVILSEGITSIGKGAFCCIPKLTSVKIPNSVTKIEFGAFEKCTNLKNVIIADKGIEYIGNQAFNGCESLRSFNLPDTLTEIGNYAFMNCTSLSSIILPDSLTDIGGDTFAGCYGLRSVTLPQEITKIDGGIFSDCTSLKSIVIPNGVKMIGLDAFSNCISLTSIIIPNSVTSLSGFSGCTGLTSIKIPNSVTSIEENAFSNCSKLTEVEIPDSVKYIEERAFEECSNLTGITIPNSVTSIGKLAFRSCSSLTSITIPNSVMSIGNFAFEDCSSLTSITIPSSVTWIGYDAFYGCTNLVIYGENGSYAEIYAKENNIPFIGNTDNDPTTPPNTEKAKQLLELLKKPKEYNNDLAILASEMSQKTYSSREEIENFYKVEYGCSKCIVNNYATPISATISAYSIAKIKSADNTEILIIAAQGTTRLYEIVKDATAGTKTTCEGKAVFDIVEDFYISIVNGLDQITENNKKYKILLTGHSLGGAAVNLLAARIINGDINSRLSKTISAEVFCYPFAPINCIKSDKLIEKGFENIHNIYNVLDTFSPLQYGGYLITGMGTGVGKFGKLHSYLYEYRDPGKIEGDEVEI